MNFSLSTFLKISLMALASMSFIVTAAPLTQEQQNQVRDLIRETLVNNPQILENAVTAWQQQSAERASAQLTVRRCLVTQLAREWALKTLS